MAADIFKLHSKRIYGPDIIIMVVRRRRRRRLWQNSAISHPKLKWLPWQTKETINTTMWCTTMESKSSLYPHYRRVVVFFLSFSVFFLFFGLDATDYLFACRFSLLIFYYSISSKFCVRIKRKKYILSSHTLNRGKKKSNANERKMNVYSFHEKE